VRAVLVGLGAVGARSARQLLSSTVVDGLLVLARRPHHVAPNIASLDGRGTVELAELSAEAFIRELPEAAVVLLAAPVTAPYAGLAVARGVPVVSVTDAPEDVRSLLALGGDARRHGVAVVAGAGMAPGLSCLLAAAAAEGMDELHEVHVATVGTGGPACARRRHAALRELVEEWRDGAWERKVASSGRELVWFPELGGADCYRTSRADPLLMAEAFPGLRRATTRAAASRRDRFTSWLPMLRPPHPEGAVGALRVEVRGRRQERASTVLLGANGRPALVAGTVAALAAELAAARLLKPGAGGLASLAPNPRELLAELSRRGVRTEVFEGAGPTPTS
jgi:saccharopine dehydrogenase-like NADP-dependent oxidoreductase